jgi:hypothetical protein
VIALGAGVVTIGILVGILGWVYLDVIILGGIGLIWWATERAWRNFLLVLRAERRSPREVRSGSKPEVAIGLGQVRFIHEQRTLANAAHWITLSLLF